MRRRPFTPGNVIKSMHIKERAAIEKKVKHFAEMHKIADYEAHTALLFLRENPLARTSDAINASKEFWKLKMIK